MLKFLRDLWNSLREARRAFRKAWLENRKGYEQFEDCDICGRLIVVDRGDPWYHDFHDLSYVCAECHEPAGREAATTQTPAQ